MKRIVSATAIYTGGGIYCYYGKLADGNYFLTSDCWEDGDVLIVNEDPYEEIEESCYEDWQIAHTVEEIEDTGFWNKMLDWIIENKPEGNYDPYELGNRKF